MGYSQIKLRFRLSFILRMTILDLRSQKKDTIISAIKSVGLKTVYIYIHQPLWKSMMKIFPVPLYFYTLPKNTSMSLLMEKTA